MKKNLTVCALALAITFAMAGCTSEKAPNVTPTPSPITTTTPSVKPTESPMATPSSMPDPTITPEGAVGSAHRPMNYGTNHSTAYDNGRYYANGFYHGTDAQDIARDMTNGVRGAVDGTGRVVEDIGNGIRNMTH